MIYGTTSLCASLPYLFFLHSFSDATYQTMLNGTMESVPAEDPGNMIRPWDISFIPCISIHAINAEGQRNSSKKDESKEKT